MTTWNQTVGIVNADAVYLDEDVDSTVALIKFPNEDFSQTNELKWNDIRKKTLNFVNLNYILDLRSRLNFHTRISLKISGGLS